MFTGKHTHTHYYKHDYLPDPCKIILGSSECIESLVTSSSIVLALHLLLESWKQETESLDDCDQNW